MAQRPVFLPLTEGKSLVQEVPIEFKWHPGMAVSQKQKSIQSLHNAAKKRTQKENILEISSKSESELGRQLSAFVLSFVMKSGVKSTVECAFQGSKVFRNGGPYSDLYGTNSRAAKKDHRIGESGSLLAFSLEGEEWPIVPQTYFYDWIYINALQQHVSMSRDILNYDIFTDIEFNPAKSINCQARSVAQYVSMSRRGVLDDALCDKNLFSSFYQGARKVEFQQQLL
jgi:hypothetical protein